MQSNISNSHRKELLEFLLLKTAAVRRGIKPATLLRVQHCYKSKNSDGLQFCLYREDILNILKLDYLELRTEEDSSLILFYHEKSLKNTLLKKDNIAILKNSKYPINTTLSEILEELKNRFTIEKIPHEVGVFIGYPAKDVQGFMDNLPRTPIHKGDWAVFGDAQESLKKMKLYRQVEKIAKQILDACEELPHFIDALANLKVN